MHLQNDLVVPVDFLNSFRWTNNRLFESNRVISGLPTIQELSRRGLKNEPRNSRVFPVDPCTTRFLPKDCSQIFCNSLTMRFCDSSLTLAKRRRFRRAVIKRRVAGCSGAAAYRNRIVERTHQGIRRTDVENRQRSIPGSVLAEAGEGCRNADRADLYPDDRRPSPVSEESRGRLFSGIATWPEELRGERTTEGHQQRGRPVSANDDGARRALHFGAVWRRQ